MGLRGWLAVASLVSSMFGVVACQSSTFACQSNDACPEGRCEPQGWCSFPDASCPSGFRFGDHAAEGLADVCVELIADETDGGTSTTAAATTGPVTTTAPDAPSTTDPSGVDSTGTTSTTATTAGSGSSGPSIETTGPAGSVVVTVPIAADADDGAMYDTPEGQLMWAPSGEDGIGNGFFGEYPDGEYYVAYFRFALPEPIETATLVDARLRLEATRQLTYLWSDNHAAGIWLESDGDAPVVTGSDAFPTSLGGASDAGVSLLGLTIRWPTVGPLVWMPGTNASPDLSPLVSALRDQTGSLSAGDHIQFWLAVASPIGTGGEVTYVDYASRLGTPPELELTFEQR